MKKLICFILAFGLILAGSVCAFADDPEETPTSSGDRLATQEEIDETNLLILEAAESIYSLQSEPTRSTYTIDDIYNLLADYVYYRSGQSSNALSRLTYEELITVRQYCYTINSSLNSLVVTASGINSTLTNFYNSVNGDYATTGISIYDELRTIITFISSVDPNDQILTLPEYLMVINSNLEDCALYLSSIVSSQASIDSKLTNIYNYLSTLNTSIQSVLTATQAVKISIDLINTSLSSIYSEIQSLQNDYNNITWLNSNGAHLGFTKSYTNISYFDSFDFTSGTFYSDIRLDGKVSRDRIYKIQIPLYNNIPTGNYSINSAFFIYGGNKYYAEVLYDYITSNSIYAYVYFPKKAYDSNFHLFIELYVSNTGQFRLNGVSSIQYLTIDYSDFYDVYNWLINKKQTSILEKFEYIYASNDLIEAKQNQQSYEDTAIEDFTGSGSASASVSDLGNLKSVSGSLKSGLSSGGSVNNALAIFNINSGFWSWFSQSNYDDINTVYGSNTSLRNSSNSDNTEDSEQILDFYSNNQRDLFNLLENGD